MPVEILQYTEKGKKEKKKKENCTSHLCNTLCISLIVYTEMQCVTVHVTYATQGSYEKERGEKTTER